MTWYFVNTSTERIRRVNVAHGRHLKEILYTLSLILELALFTMSCSTPKEISHERLETSSENRLETYESGAADDSTTIIHHRRDDSTIITKIIRHITYENREASRSNTDSTAVGTSKRTDTITPGLVKIIMKGFAVACIGVGLTVLGLLLVVVILLFKSSQRGRQP